MKHRLHGVVVASFEANNGGDEDEERAGHLGVIIIPLLIPRTTSGQKNSNDKNGTPALFMK